MNFEFNLFLCVHRQMVLLQEYVLAREFDKVELVLYKNHQNKVQEKNEVYAKVYIIFITYKTVMLYTFLVLGPCSKAQMSFSCHKIINF